MNSSHIKKKETNTVRFHIYRADEHFYEKLTLEQAKHGYTPTFCEAKETLAFVNYTNSQITVNCILYAKTSKVIVNSCK